ncbi:MAG: hypothetical protein U0K52_06385 [Clostridia bacterium]|jgi:hypothetical protein|nr:hypothetical protein [Clostridia bacterium]
MTWCFFYQLKPKAAKYILENIFTDDYYNKIINIICAIIFNLSVQSAMRLVID